MQYKNFYENAKEGNHRLKGTIVWYHGPGEEGPYYVLCICDHPSGDLKIYMKKLGQKLYNVEEYPPTETFGGHSEGLAEHMDAFMKKYPKFNLVRKDLSSPHFRAFRPFPLGMMNAVIKNPKEEPVDCAVAYLERQPLRVSSQGLIKTMIHTRPVTAAGVKKKASPVIGLDLFGKNFLDCCEGRYPSIDTCLSNMTDPNIANEAAAFHRQFAIVRGPMGLLFLSYKGDIVGLIDNKNLSSVTVDTDFKYTREAISDLKIFRDIRG